MIWGKLQTMNANQRIRDRLELVSRQWAQKFVGRAKRHCTIKPNSALAEPVAHKKKSCFSCATGSASVFFAQSWAKVPLSRAFWTRIGSAGASHSPAMNIALYVAVVVTLFPAMGHGQSSRKFISLDGTWKLTANGTARDVTVPGTFEQQVAADFDGVGVYERLVEPFVIPEHHRLLIRFEGAATETVVWFNETQVGSHLGAWTPFTFDVTDWARASPNGPWQIKVQVDEKVGHNTQGFLPVIQPHFGGLWQCVQLVIVPETWIDQDYLMAIGERASNSVRVEVPIRSAVATPNCHIEFLVNSPGDDGNLNLENGGQSVWRTVAEFELRENEKVLDLTRDLTGEWHNGKLKAYVPIDMNEFCDWSPDRPNRYELRIKISNDHSRDEVTTWFGIRDMSAGLGLWSLNAKWLKIRGVLNWGYAPPLTSPSLDEAWMRNEIETAKSYGFNLMKFCLWVPPKRYLELCDELGMLAWVEYPTWHPQLTKEHLAPLRQEYSEFFAHDRNHPSVILRSLTCETGSGADLDVIQSLYDLCKIQVPHSIVEDDSSWIEWNRISDFYDDHPYGNNHTWPATLKRLNEYIAGREIKPLILGEAIAADTWTSPRRYSEWSKTVAPHHRPGFLVDNARWLERTKLDDAELAITSRHYAMLMRKYQIECFRRLAPDGGYVVSVIRDFPLAGMGLIDYAGVPKWNAIDWSFHGETMLLLATENDRRSFFDDEPICGKLSISHFGNRLISDGRLDVKLILPKSGDDFCAGSQSIERILASSEYAVTQHEITFPPFHVSKPTRFNLVANLSYEDRILSNQWSLWIFPRATEPMSVVAHPSIAKELPQMVSVASIAWADRQPGQVICVSRLDQELVDTVARGESVWLLPDGERGSFGLEDHWFLRGGPAIFPAASRLFGSDWVARASDAIVELQHFDLAGPVVPNIDSMLDDITPMVALWDNHDRVETRTHGLLFEIPVGRGRLFISALDHRRPTNAAGHWLSREIINYLAKPLNEPDVARGTRNAARLNAELSRNDRELQSDDWRFQPDPTIDGEKNGWQATDFDDAEWKTIKADRHWEGQGYESLDNWAWYRLRVPLDEKWAKAEKLFLNFTGVDDHYRLFINGQFVGSSGDVATKKTAFDERKSYDISEFVGKGDSIQIAIAVYDWYGAGGIFRPVTLSTQPLSDDRPWLK